MRTSELAAALLNGTPAVANNDVPAKTGKIIRLSDVQPEPVEWLWPGRIAIGELTLVAGDPGLGKSLLTIDLASRVSTGSGFPDRPGEQQTPGGVVLLSAEDDLARTVRPRLDAAGADVTKIVAVQGVKITMAETSERCFDLTKDRDVLEKAIAEARDCRLFVIDPISAFMGDTDSHKNAEIRGVLGPLAELARRWRVAGIAVTHLRKGDGSAVYRPMGSMAFIAAARAGWAVSRDKDDVSGKRRLFLPLKNNLGPDEGGLAFEVQCIGSGTMPTLCWAKGAVDLSADDALAPPVRNKRGPDSDAKDAAAEWLRARLASGPRLAKELFDEADAEAGISRATLKRAKKSIDAKVYRNEVPGPWYWRLGGDSQEDQSPPIPKQPDPLGPLAPLAENTAKSDALSGAILQGGQVTKLEPLAFDDDGRVRVWGVDHE